MADEENMFDFAPVIQQQAKLSKLTAQLTVDDLRQWRALFTFVFT